MLCGPPIYATCGVWLECLNALPTNPVTDSIKTLAVETYEFLPQPEKNRGKNPHSPSASQNPDDRTAFAVSMLRGVGASKDQGSGFDRFRSGLLRFLQEFSLFD
ncbi:hypothetical protein SAY86_008593 [Trapa natans]|uniref:Uncharacterized protein n=1 Tax=Trapa natans TaxID=22666 RepID=A0AAN7K8U4_TRANT|nr:hypothetical protein SAY86_008593 [Trapa natans]